MEFLLSKNRKIFQTEEAYQLFLDSQKPIAKQETFKLRIAQKLENLGFFELDEQQYVTCTSDDECWNSWGIPDYECREQIRIPNHSKSDTVVVCKHCGREFLLSEAKERITSFVTLRPKYDAFLRLFEERMTEQKLHWQRLELGCYGLFQGVEPTILAITDFFPETDQANSK
jgi:hypothetical protein